MLFKDAFVPLPPLSNMSISFPTAKVLETSLLFQHIQTCQRPICVIGRFVPFFSCALLFDSRKGWPHSQAVRAKYTKQLVEALEILGLPVYLSGMGRGLLVGSFAT